MAATKKTRTLTLSPEKLVQRSKYGGRKGRSAGRRLKAWTMEKPDPTLEQLIEKARLAPPPSPEAQEAQRRSFAYGNLALSGSAVTRLDIDEAAEKLDRESCSGCRLQDEPGGPQCTIHGATP